MDNRTTSKTVPLCPVLFFPLQEVLSENEPDEAPVIYSAVACVKINTLDMVI